MIPLQRTCEGVVTGVRKSGTRDFYMVQVYKSPVGELLGSIPCTPIYAHRRYYRTGDKVAVTLHIVFDPVTFKFMEPDLSHGSYIVGLVSGNNLVNDDVDCLFTIDKGESEQFLNTVSGVGMASYNNGEVVLFSGDGSYRHHMVAGEGVYEKSILDKAQNFHRVVSDSAPMYSARDHFGKYYGTDLSDKMSNKEPYYIRRSFTPLSDDHDSYITTCEGVYSPFFGPNNAESISIDKKKDVLFYKAIQSKDRRITIEAGEIGESMLSIRLDKVIKGETSSGIDNVVIPSILGNLFRMNISDSGDLDVSVGGGGVPGTNPVAVKITVSSSGDISLTTAGDMFMGSPDKRNGLKITSSGVDIDSTRGVRVNGKPVIDEDLLIWLKSNYAKLFLPVVPGSPPVPEPSALARLTTIFPSIDKGVPHVPTQVESDVYSTS